MNIQVETSIELNPNQLNRITFVSNIPYCVIDFANIIPYKVNQFLKLNHSNKDESKSKKCCSKVTTQLSLTIQWNAD